MIPVADQFLTFEYHVCRGELNYVPKSWFRHFKSKPIFFVENQNGKINKKVKFGRQRGDITEPYFVPPTLEICGEGPTKDAAELAWRRKFEKLMCDLETKHKATGALVGYILETCWLEGPIKHLCYCEVSIVGMK